MGKTLFFRLAIEISARLGSPARLSAGQRAA
jgi:hypothetical protein